MKSRRKCDRPTKSFNDSVIGTKDCKNALDHKRQKEGKVPAAEFDEFDKYRILFEGVKRFVRENTGIGTDLLDMVALCDDERPERLESLYALKKFDETPAKARLWKLLLDEGREVMVSVNLPTPSDEAGNKTVPLTWQEAAKKLERLRRQGEAFESMEYYGDEFGCSKSTIKKAIDKTNILQPGARPAMASNPIAQSLSDIHIDNIPQITESDPADYIPDEDVDKILEKLVNELPEAERSDEVREKFDAMTPERRREIALAVANNPRGYDRILDRRP